MEVPPDSSHPAGQGLIGLGPSEGSVIFETFAGANQEQATTVLDNIFLQNTTTPNFITFSLQRINDPGEVFSGDLTVGETLTNSSANISFANIVNQPKLSVTIVSASNEDNQHFQTLLDADGFIGPDGSSIPITSVVSSTSNKKQATVVIDSGFSLPQVPSSVSKAIYGSFNGAELVNDPSVGQIWILPCTQEVNITLKFGGNSYPVHPLDASIDPQTFGLPATQTSSGENACYGLFQPVSFDTGSNPTYDIIFGMAFLRNVYTLINFGDFISGTTSKATPYMQFLSLTDPAEAHSDFVQVRLGGVDTTTNVMTHTGSSSSSSNKTIYYIIAACVLGALVLLTVGAFFIRRKRSRQHVYRPLHLPAPNVGQPQMYQQGPMYGGAAPPVYNPDRPYDPPQEHVPYHNPWEGRRH